MRMPTKARYGMRAMLDLAMHDAENEPVLMRDVASRQGLSEKYLEQVLIPLRHAGLVKSVRGAKGGYMLARSPAETSLLEIVEAGIGDVSMVDCVEDPENCRRVDSCATYVVWKELAEAIKASLGSKTLSDLMDIEQGLQDERAAMFHI
jgi:Rrf2 family protein